MGIHNWVCKIMPLKCDSKCIVCNVRVNYFFRELDVVRGGRVIEIRREEDGVSK